LQTSRFDGHVGEWIASGCKGERPEVTSSLVAAERELAEKAADARAAKAALPAHEAVQSEAAALVRIVSAERDRAQVLAAIGRRSRNPARDSAIPVSSPLHAGGAETDCRRTQHADFPHCAPPFASRQGLWDLSHCRGAADVRCRVF
jgi:hypothetical protein